MSTRTINDVTLPHTTANTASKLLSEYASFLERRVWRTRSDAVRDQVRRDAEQCRKIADLIVKGLFTWTGTQSGVMEPHAGDSRCVCTDGREAERDVCEPCN